MKLRTRLFLASFGIATASVLLAVMVASSTSDRIIALLSGLLVALAGALVLALVISSTISRRISGTAAIAQRYAAGDLKPQVGDYETDEIGVVEQAFEGAVQKLGKQIVELSRNRRLTDAILSGMTEGVLVVNARGYVQTANDAVCDMLQFNSSPVERHYIELIRHPDMARQIRSALEHTESSRIEITLDTTPTKACLVSAAPFSSEDEPGVVVVLHDVTDYRRAEQIRQDFVANVSHELRTPLTAIRGSIDALFGEEGVTGDPRFLEIIARHTARMERLVSDLLRLARLDAGEETLNCLSFSTRDLFTGVQNELLPLFKDKNLALEIQIKAGTETVFGDPTKLHDVLKNLVENAAHYAPEDTTIRLTAVCGEANTITICVEDRGPGIPDIDLSRVFERFYRVERSRVRNPGGTGLGLAIVKHLVGLHDGTVFVKNRRDGGSVFSVNLPNFQGEESPPADGTVPA
jgi:two-component system phosphate regulon sensor histidine kinase PhoR